MELVGPIFDVLKCLGDPTCRFIDHHRKLEERKTDLQERLGQLNAIKIDVERRIKAELRWGNRTREEVEKWLLDAQAINDKMRNIDERMQNVSCFSRARLGKRVAQMVEQVEKIIERGRFTDALVIDDPSTAGVPFHLEHLEGETIVKAEIWDCLMVNAIGMIGVCGMGGIGKTTIMKHIYNELLKETKPLFDKIIWVTVSKELNITKLQSDIADAMNILDFPESESKRVAILKEKLGRGRFVLILDDVWEKFSLLEVGIPIPTSSNGSKLVLTSREIRVCESMDCEIVRVPPLSNEESMNLFLEHVGRGVLKVPSLNEILPDIVGECDGLPLAIAVIGGSMKGVYDVAEWRNALREIRDHVTSVEGTEVEILYKRLKVSFDRLRDVNIQNCFLYCSLYPEDYKIPREELMEYWIDEGFLETGSRQQLNDKGHTILNTLVNKCLLEKAGGDNVRMHDVLRDMAFYIKPHFMVKAGTKLKELPSKKDWKEDLERVSFMRNNVSEIPSHLSPSCENLSTLSLKNNRYLKRIPDSFFQHMHNLSILDLSYTGIKRLPNSVSNMEKLNALVLRECRMLRHVPSLEKLKALRKLDLRHTAIKKVPKGLEMLVNLTYLNLRAKSLKELPMAILHKLSCLQCLILYIKSSVVKMDGSVAARLRKLEIFEGRFLYLTDFNTYCMSVKAQRLISYSLVMAPPGAKFNVVGNHRFLVIHISNASNSTIPEVMEAMDAKEGVESAFFNLTKGLLHVFGQSLDVVKIVSRLRKKHHALVVPVGPERPRLKDLLPKKEVILSGGQIRKEDPVVVPTDLRFLRFHGCHNMRSLNDMSLPFQQTNELRSCTVEDCKEIESVLDLSLSSSPCNPLENLEYLWLERLHKLHFLVKVGEASVISPVTTALPVPNIFSHLKSLVIVGCLNMKQLFRFELAHHLQNLEELEVWHCVQMEEIIGSDEDEGSQKGKGTKTPTEFSLPKLKRLELMYLPELKSICGSSRAMACNRLTEIVVWECTELKRMPLYLPLFQNRNPSVPSLHPLKLISISPKEWWETVEWDYPNAKKVLQPWLKVPFIKTNGSLDVKVRRRKSAR